MPRRAGPLRAKRNRSRSARPDTAFALAFILGTGFCAVSPAVADGFVFAVGQDGRLTSVSATQDAMPVISDADTAPENRLFLFAAPQAAVPATSAAPASQASRGSPDILGVGGILAIGGLGWAALQADTETPMPTAAPEEFRTAGSNFGDFAPLLPVVAAPVPAPPATGPSATELALMESLAALRAELDALRAQQAAPTASGSDDAIAGLTAQITALVLSATATQRDLERQLADRAREIEQMRMNLELARLEQPPSGLPDRHEEDLRLADLERRRLAEAEALAARVASPMIAWSGMGAADSGAEAQNDQRLSADEAFVRIGAVAATVTRSQVIVNPSQTVRALSRPPR